MTPEETLDWLAQQHFDQCREERPIQDWIRKMKSQLPAQPEQESVEDLQAKLKWATEQLEANINWEFVAAAKEEMLKAAWAEIKELRKQIKEPEQERCVGCEACIDTACGRDECPKGWPKAAQPEQEPAKWMYPDALCDRSCLYVCTKAFTQFPECATTPPQRTWVGLTDEEMEEVRKQAVDLFVQEVKTTGKGRNEPIKFGRLVEAKLKEKNT